MDPRDETLGFLTVNGCTTIYDVNLFQYSGLTVMVAMIAILNHYYNSNIFTSSSPI